MDDYMRTIAKFLNEETVDVPIKEIAWLISEVEGQKALADKYRKALEDVAKHQKFISMDLYVHSAVYRIAKKALEREMEKSIYLVWSPQSSNVLTVKHDTFTEAKFEARRLAEQTPGNDFFVLKAVESVCYKPSPFIKMVYSQDER